MMRDIISELKAERQDLEEKLAKLDKAITNCKLLGISSSHASLMSDQWRAMKSYVTALDNRIKDLEK